MLYQTGDYVYPADLPRPHLCRVAQAETLRFRGGRAQMLKLEPLEGPWPPGTNLVRLDEYVMPVRPRQLWQASPSAQAAIERGKRHANTHHRHAA